MLDDFITFGRSGLRVSRFALGAFNFGGRQGWSLDASAAHQLIGRYRELGGNFLDVANSYGNGEAEVIIGDYLAAEAGARDRLVIASKFGSNTRARDPNAGGAGRKAIMQTCEESLRRLRTDRIDLYWMHLWDPFTPMEETLRALDDLTSAGKILHIGLSNTPAWKIAEAHWVSHWRNYMPIAGLQLQYSLMERSIEIEHVPMAQAYGMGVAAWSPLRNGALSGRYRKAEPARHDAEGRAIFVGRALNDRSDAILDTLIEVAGRNGITPSQAALAWLRVQPTLAMILLGAHTIEQLSENAAAAMIDLPPEDLAVLDEASKPHIPYPGDFARRAIGSVGGGTRINGVTAPPGSGSPSQGGGKA